MNKNKKPRNCFEAFLLSGRRGSNPRPSAWKADALPTELLPQLVINLWAKMDSNHRRHKPADLQSAPFGHSGIRPSSNRMQIYNYFLILQNISRKFYHFYCSNSCFHSFVTVNTPCSIQSLLHIISS